MFEPFITWIEATPLAGTVRNSTQITAVLSSVHLIGLALIAGGALFSTLTRFGAFVAREYRADAIRPAARAVTTGLVISVTTGLMLFAPRASAAAENRAFVIKMSLLVLAALVHFTLQLANRREPLDNAGVRAAGALGLVLWLGVALAGCAFIFIE